MEAKNVFTGRYIRYGDFFRVWQIDTSESYEAVRDWCLENLARREIPESAVWHRHQQDEEWVCENQRSDYFTDYTPYNHHCEDWEEKEK